MCETTKRDSRLISFEEACDHLGMNESWLRRRVLRNEIRHAKLGGLLRFRRDWLDEYVKANTVEPVDDFDFADQS